MDDQKVSLASLFLVYLVLSEGRCNVGDGSTDVPGYKTRYVEVQVDHFSFANSDTFQLRYLVNDTYYKDGDPIFFYTGNEGDIEDFVKNTGLLIEMAPRFGALVIFAEHRYYGQSLPYGKESFKDPAHLGYLTSTQALADFAVLITHLKETVPGAANSPVFAFGGSYGGMLAAWIRMKYPHLVAGSLASAASIFQYPGITDCEAYSHVATRTFQRSGAGCPERIRSSWDVIQDLGKTDAGRHNLTSMFRLCEPLAADDMPTLVNWLVNLWMIYALTDYPYPADFLTPLPAWPVKEACHLITSHEDVLSGVAAATKLYFNFTGQAVCLDISQPYYGGLAWQYQACTEQIEPICSDGVNDMFPAIPWDLVAFSQACYQRWKVRPRPYWAVTEYWGRNISAASNIIFSNGDLDPWSAGCVLKSLSDSLIAIVMEDAAHHLDLRPSNPADPPSVLKARAQEADIIEKWIQEYHLTT
ncbi:lysosomal Pro-X carboxypeptidase-like [Branchiostoma lanceolatum]|uniref:lysosomal Pro-X carboxypeptidase-like n=1 Tax=Branchiostoma lanceolatum TaxID=7740 RepID=UPI0034563415